MKEILEALKAEILESMPEIREVHVLADPDLLPAGVQFPCVGLKDGPVLRSEGVDDTVALGLDVNIYIYVQILKEEASIMGSGAGSGAQKGLLDLMADIHSALEHNLLDVSGVIHAFCNEEFGSETMLAGVDVFVQRKGCRYVYEIQ